MKFEVVSTREFSEEDLQYAVEKAIEYFERMPIDELDEACRMAFWQMIDRIEEQDDSSIIVEEWEWCVFMKVVIEEIQRRLEIYYCG